MKSLWFVAFDILKRGHGALHAAEVTAGGVSKKGWIEQMGEIIVHELEPRHVIGVVEEVVLPGCVSESIDEDRLRSGIDIFGNLNDTPIPGGILEPGDVGRVVVRLKRDVRVVGAHRSAEEPFDIVVSETVDVIVLEPVPVGRADVVLGEGLVRISELGAEVAVGKVAHRTALATVAIDLNVGKIGAAMLINHVENHRHSTRMTGADETLQTRRTAPAVLGCKEMQRPVAPVEHLRKVGDRHQLEHVDSQTSQVVELRNNVIEGGVELRNLQLIDNEIVEWRYGEPAISKCERSGRLHPFVQRERGQLGRPRLSCKRVCEERSDHDWLRLPR